MTRPTCGNCRFWDDSPSRDAGGDLLPIEGMVPGTVLGQCRRSPPCVAFDSAVEGDVNAVFPETYQGQWCGEHAPAAEGGQP